MASRRRRRRRVRRRKSGSWFSRLSIGKKIGVCFSGILLCFVATGVIYVAAKLGKIETEEIPKEDIIINEEVEQKLADLGEGYLNVALFGVDSREGDLGEGTRTDCIIVASLNKETKEIRMVSVYRDTVLDLSEGTLQKCNAAYSFGGAKMAINMLNMNLDLDIKDYVTVDFAAIAEAIDLLGGIEIDVLPEEVDPMNEYIGETATVAEKEANLIAEAGMQHLDGVQATTYARIRSTAGGDFTRTERQRLVIQKIVEKAQKSDLGTINKIIDAVFPKISTSFSVAEILNYAQYFAEYKLGVNTGFPMDKTTDTISGLGSVVIPVDLADNVKQLHEFLFRTNNYSPSSTVNTVSENIIARVGQRDVTSDEELNNQMYQVDPQEGPNYSGPDYWGGETNGDRDMENNWGSDNGTNEDGTWNGNDNGTWNGGDGTWSGDENGGGNNGNENDDVSNSSSLWE